MHEAVGFLWALGASSWQDRVVFLSVFADFIVLSGKRLEVVTHKRRAFHVTLRRVVGVNPRFVLLRLWGNQAAQWKPFRFIYIDVFVLRAVSVILSLSPLTKVGPARRVALQKQRKHKSRNGFFYE